MLFSLSFAAGSVYVVVVAGIMELIVVCLYLCVLFSGSLLLISHRFFNVSLC